MKRMAETADIKAWKYTDSPDITPGEAEKLREIPHSISVFEICGPMFFAAADQLLGINSDHRTKAVVIRMRSVPAIDASAMKCLPSNPCHCSFCIIWLFLLLVGEP